MSQEKVNHYKEQKPKRKTYSKRKKIKDFLWGAGALLVLAAAIFWVAYSGIQKRQADQARTVVEVNTDAITEYATALSEETSAEETSSEETQEEESAEEAKSSEAASSESSAQEAASSEE